MEQPCLHTRPGLCHHVTMSHQHGGVQQQCPLWKVWCNPIS